MACSTGCKTKDHASLSECLRSKSVGTTGINSVTGTSTTQQRQWRRDLDYYRGARAEGIQPATTRRADVEQAKILSDYTGTAFKA